MSTRRTPPAHKRLRVDDRRDISRTAGAAGSSAPPGVIRRKRGIKPQRAEPSGRQRPDTPRGEAGYCGADRSPTKNRREYPAQSRRPATAGVPPRHNGCIFRCRRNRTTCRDRFRWSGVRSRSMPGANTPDSHSARRHPFLRGGSSPYSGVRPEPAGGGKGIGRRLFLEIYGQSRA